MTSVGGTSLERDRHPHAGVYPVWGGIEDAADFDRYPWAKGAHLFSTWAELKPTEDGPYRWNVLDDLAAQRLGERRNKMAYLQVNADWPDWVYDHVAQASYTERGQHPPQFWDPVYIDLYTAFIQDLAAHIAQAPYADQIVLVRAQYNAFNPERIRVRQDSQMLYSSYSPTPDGHRYEVDLTREIGNDYARQITQAYVDAFAPLGILAVQKPFGYWWYDEELADEWVEMGAGFFMTNESPNPPNRHKIMQWVKENPQTRSFSEPITWAGADLFSDVGRGQVLWWSTLAALHQGMEFISYYGADIDNAEFEEIFSFANRYAGWHREPERAPGAWIAFRGMRGECAWTFEGNYEYLMREIASERSLGLFAYTANDFMDSALNPFGKPTHNLGSDRQKEGIWARFTRGQPMYLDLDDTFAASLNQEILIRVVYFDAGVSLMGIAFNDANGELQEFTWRKSDTWTWKTHGIVTDDYRFDNSLKEGADFLLGYVEDYDDIYHMVEVVRIVHHVWLPVVLKPIDWPRR